MGCTEPPKHAACRTVAELSENSLAFRKLNIDRVFESSPNQRSSLGNYTLGNVSRAKEAK